MLLQPGKGPTNEVEMTLAGEARLQRETGSMTTVDLAAPGDDALIVRPMPQRHARLRRTATKNQL